MTNTCMNCDFARPTGHIGPGLTATNAPTCMLLGIPLASRHDGSSADNPGRAALGARDLGCTMHSWLHDTAPSEDNIPLGVRQGRGCLSSRTSPTAPPGARKPEACSGCVHFINVDRMDETYGIQTPGCAARGIFIPMGQGREAARFCEHGVAGPQDPDLPGQDDLAWPYKGNITVLRPGERMPAMTAAPDPSTFDTEAEVTAADAAAGIRAWRKIADAASGKTVLMPVFDPEFFDEVERAKIPQTGDDEHPELYRDHQGLLYKVIVLWRHLNETPALNGPAGVGKGHPVSTKVLTPKGWLPVGSLAVGDSVIGSDGRPTRVEGVFPRGKLHVNRVTMTDGASVLVDDDHLWQVQTLKQRVWGAGNHQVLSTREIREKGLRAGDAYRYSIPMVSPIQYEQADLPIHPYLLGVLLANGALTSGEAVYSTNDETVIMRVGVHARQAERTPTPTRRHVMKQPDLIDEGMAPNEIWVRLGQLGLAGKRSAEKFIPEEYLRAAEWQRRELLTALMDCDGSCDGKHTAYHTTSPALADGVRELVHSLGGTASISRSKRSDGELRVAVAMGSGPFSTPRKRDAWAGVQHRAPSRRIVAIEDAGHDDVVCIQVAAKDHLYVTEDHIVTHNTELFRYAAWSMQLPFERFSITSSTELDDLQGRVVFEDGETRWQNGRVPTAWAKPCVIVIDEPNVGPPDVWQFLRPLTDDSKQLVLDANKGERIDRNPHCYMGMAFNPSWDMRNVGTHEISDADGSRLMHIAVQPPSEDVEREIIAARCALDGYKVPDAVMDQVMGVAKDLRALAAEDAFPMHWGVRQQIKVARATQWFSTVEAYRLAAGDLLDPEAADQLLVTVRSHTPTGKAKPRGGAAAESWHTARAAGGATTHMSLSPSGRVTTLIPPY